MGLLPQGLLVRVRPRCSFRPWFVLGLIVIVSAAARFAAALGINGPWIAPDEMVYALSGRSFWETGDLRALGTDAPFYGLYPILVGLPLALLEPAHGLVLLKGVQAVLVSLTTAVVFVWARNIVRARWALVAAAMTAALPALAYASLIMSEAAYLPAATLALLAMARVLEQPSRRNQLLALGAIGLAIAMRLQGAILLPTLLLAVVLFAWFARNAMTARRLLPLVATLSISLVAGLALVATGVVDRPLGAYTGAATTSYDPGAVLRWIGLHAGDVALLVVGVPIVGTLILAVDAARGRERDPAVQALLAITLAYTSATVVVVGTFASTYVQQLAERNLITAAPAIFVAFAVWLDRGVPRPQPSSLIVALAVVVPVGLLPVSGVASEAAFPDAFMTAPLIVLERHLSDLSVALLWAAATIGVTLLAVLVPRRGAALLPSVVLACLIAASALATEEMGKRSELDRHDFFGAASTRWIDRSVRQPVAYLYDGHPLWNAVWHTAFWNEHVTAVAALRGPIPGISTAQARVHVRAGGRIVRADGTPLRQRMIVAPRNVTLDGVRVREIPQGFNQPGLVIWRTRGAPRLRSWTVGTVAKGDLVQRLTSTIYTCRPGIVVVSLTGGSAQGRAKLTLHSVDRRREKRSLQSAGSVEVTLPPGSPWTGSLRTPHGDGIRTCVLTIASDAVHLGWINFVAGRAGPDSRQPVFAEPGTIALCYSEATEGRLSSARCR